MPSCRAVALTVLVVLAATRSAAAQCPDGTPPPCAAPRRDPPLDPRTWLILPFANAANAADAAIIAQASVNLLYQDLSRFSELRVVSDDRVADLVRRLSPEDRRRPTLTTGRELARRVGAGTLVLGDYLAAGGRAQISAKLYDVRTARELRAVREPVNGYAAPDALDSLTAAFDRVARGLLAVPTPPGARQGLIGTTSLEAFRAFHEGMAFYREWRLDSAHARLAHAVQLDSNYAWARFRLYWVSANLSLPAASYRGHLDAAARLAAALPGRERALIGGWIALPRGEIEVICGSAAELLRHDSTDAEAWHFRGHCLAGDAAVVRDPADSTRAAFRSSWHAVVSAFERGSLLDPLHGEVFSDLIAALQQRLRSGCAVAGVTPCPPNQRFLALVEVAGDTLVTRGREPATLGPRPQDRPEALAAWRHNIDRGIAAAARFTAANPSHFLGQAVLGDLYLAKGDLARAARALAAATRLTSRPAGRRSLARSRIELWLRSGQPDSAALLVDSLAADSAAYRAETQYFTAFARFSLDRLTDSVRPHRVAWLPIFAGVLPHDLDAVERRYASHLTTPTPLLELSTIVAFRMRGSGPQLDTAAAHPIRRAQALLARGDTARALTLVRTYDVELAARPAFANDDGAWLFTAELLVALGDSAMALRRLQDWAARWPAFSHPAGFVLDITPLSSGLTVRLATRTWLLLGDLAAAAGRNRDARHAYRMVLGMWQGGDAPVQPTVARVRAALERLGN
jgi:tetratricopeptide (TPR) repeat protein